MNKHEAHYEVRDGKLFVDGEAVPLRKGIVYVALARAGWNGHEGPLPLKLVADMLRLDRRVSLMALARETQSVA
ncbi:MAG: hypothetical protein EHM91_15435 [Planctomycetota bacterium]|nr:MAG: hypothetical protein EHM91_15435 [Planctomycetota bacterium]